MADADVIKSTAELFGFTLKEAQIECLQYVVKKQDCMAILPTGYGKSIIYQLAPYVMKKKFDLQNSACLVLTPLNSIMLDQILSLHKIGIKACAIDYSCSSAQSFIDYDDDDDDDDDDVDKAGDKSICATVPVEDIIREEFKVIYAHPEALLSTKKGDKFLRELERKNILTCVAVDEAHMILEWGAEFRKDFGKIGANILARFPEVPVMVFTATASEEAQMQIAKSLHLKSPNTVCRNPDRANIKYSKILRPPSSETYDHLDQILTPIADELLMKRENYPLTFIYTDTSIISYAYAFLDKKMGSNQYLGEAIPENRLFAQYHQTYTDRMKKFIVEEVCKESSVIRIVLATVALGMGLNSPHIRKIIHYKPPTSIEKYFQETGRAGRDGLASEAVLYYNNTDIRKNRPGIENSIVLYCRNSCRCMRAVMLEQLGYKPSDTVDHAFCCDFCDKL